MLLKILSAIAILEIMWGTILSVLSILKMSIKEVMRSSTLGGMGEGWKSNLTQRYYARCGISYIVGGSLLQVYLIFDNNISYINFAVAIIFSFFIPSIITAICRMIYKKQIKNGWKSPQ